MKKLVFTTSMIICALSMQAQDNPYSTFGYEPKKVNYEVVQRDYFTITNTNKGSNVKKMMLDTEGGNLYVIGHKDEIIEKVTINPNELLRFLSVDPLTGKYPELTPYQFASNTPIQAVDLDGKEAFFVHGTASSPGRWTENSKTIPVLMNLTNNVSADFGFSWEKNAGLRNNHNDRQKAASELANYVINNRNIDPTTGKNEEITLIGHSHGGNVAIQAAKIIFDKTGEKVNIITISTPAVNSDYGHAENPASNPEAINDHLHLYNTIDLVQTGLSTAAGDNLFSRTYHNNSTKNAKLDVSDSYTHGDYSRKEGEVAKSSSLFERLDAHSFDNQHPEYIQKAQENGQIQKLNPVTPTKY